MKEIISIANFSDLREYGIVVLTGEIDPYCLRVLCDLTAQGKRIISEFLGIYDHGLGPNWNIGDETNPHVASIVLPRGIFDSLATYILYHECRCEVIVVSPGNTKTGMSQELYDTRFLSLVQDNDLYSVFRNPRPSVGPISASGFNIHAATRRAM